MPENEMETEGKSQEPPEAVKQILRAFSKAGTASLESKFAYTLNIPGVCMVSFVCSEENAKEFIEAARNEAMAMVSLQLKTAKDGKGAHEKDDGPPPGSYYA